MLTQATNKRGRMEAENSTRRGSSSSAPSSEEEEEEEGMEGGTPATPATGGGANQACAACKFQRKRCSEKCQMAAYFPPERARVFQNFHRLFGVKKIQKLLETMAENERDAAMGALILQSEIRRREPVHGCAIFINQLDLLIRHAELELQHLHSHLSIFRQQQSHHHPASTSQLHHHQHHHHQQHQQQPLPPPPSSLHDVSPPPTNSSLPPPPSPALLQHNHHPDFHLDALFAEADYGLFYNNAFS